MLVTIQVWQLVVLPVVLGIGLALYRRRKSYAQHLGSVVEHHGLTFVSARTPGFFETGPFPKVEAEFGIPIVRTCGLGGQYSVCRVVRLKDARGEEHEVWARLSFAGFRLWKIDWKPALDGFVGRQNGR